MVTEKQKSKKPLKAVVGAGCCAILLTAVPSLEGTILRGYKDPIGIVTACTGHTLTAVLGKPYTKEECEALLNADLVEKAEAVLRCTPSLAGNTYPLAAAVSFAFNVGETKYCNSTMARKFNAGDILGGCAELSKWVYAGGEVSKGIVSRRKVEREICETKS